MNEQTEPAGAIYRSRILDHRADGTPNWHASCTAGGYHGYGHGTTEHTARSRAAKDLLRKLHGGTVDRAGESL